MSSVAVFGSSQIGPGSVAYEKAREMGRLLAQAGFTVVNGGYSGVMEAVSLGAREAGGKAIGVTCATFDRWRPRGNPYLSDVIHAPDLIARLRYLIEHSDAFVVMGGGVGTLLELFLVWNLLAIGAVNGPCVLVGAHWRRLLAALEGETEIAARHLAMLRVVDTPQEAVRILGNA